MALDFPTSPTNGQVYQGFVYDSGTSSWKSTSTATPLGSRLSSIESRVPAGTLHQWPVASSPAGYLLCQGQAISRTQYPNLFTAIGTTYGAGDGTTTFNLPDLQGRVPVGKSSSGTFSGLNNKNASTTETVQLDLTQIPAHTHIQNAHTHTQNAHNHTQASHSHTTNIYSDQSRLNGYMGAGANSGWGAAPTSSVAPAINGTVATNQATTATNQSTGGNVAHNNLQPYIVLNYIIKT